MNGKRSSKLAMVLALLFLAACTAARSNIQVDSESASPGTRVAFKGTPHDLIGDYIAVGDPLPSALLVQAGTMQPVDLSNEKGEILFLSIVPSIDTKVCEEQTHILGEEGDRLPGDVRRITISRDTPFAQNRFAKAAGLTDIQFLSDYKSGEFGKALGILAEDLMLLARSVIIVDEQGVVQYIQVVPEMTHLPDMGTAFDKATQLSKSGG
jgi:thioredoxin-dependent peroxiredoxin